MKTNIEFKTQNPFQMETFKAAVKENQPEVVKELLKTIDPSFDSNWAIGHAASNGYLEVVKVLLQDERTDPSDNDHFAFNYSAHNGHVKVAEYLLQDKRINPNSTNYFAIGVAAREGHIEVVRILLADPRVDPSGDDNFAVRRAVERGHTGIVKLLLQDKRIDQKVALEVAQSYEREEIINLIKEVDEIRLRSEGGKLIILKVCPYCKNLSLSC